MRERSFVVEPVAYVMGGRAEPTDDYWGSSAAVIRIDAQRFGPDSTMGLEEFSHLEVVYRFHLADPHHANLTARHPRNNPALPLLGVFAQRNIDRFNWLAVSRCRLIKVDGLDLHVEDLDAVDQTPVLDIKPWFNEFGPRGQVREPAWPHKMLGQYFASPHPGESAL